MPEFIRPAPLRPGETIGIVAPSGSVLDMTDRVRTGIDSLQAMGYRIRIGRHVYDEWMGLAGRHEARVQDFNDMLRDPDVRMVMATHGGFGCLALLDAIDYSAIKTDPKWVSGMSDLTILLNAITTKTNVMTLHGPDVAFTFGMPDPRESAWFTKVIGTGAPAGLLPTWRECPRVIRPGRGEGRTWGGTLAMLGYLLATPWAPDLSDAVLVLEGYSLNTPTAHRWLQVLRLGGHLAKLRGMVLGIWSRCFEDRDDPQGTLEALIRDACAGTDFPIIQVDSIGHDTPNVPWLVGGSGIVSEAGLELC